MNDVVVPWCRAQKIEVTRSRAYKKNDQAFVEQKNGAVVRRLVGYGRFDGVETATRDGASLRGGASARELLPAVVQAEGEASRGRKGHQALSRAGDALSSERWLIPSCPRPSSGGCARPIAVSTRWRCWLRSARHRTSSASAIGKRRACSGGRLPFPVDPLAFARSLGTTAKTAEVRATHRRPKRRYKKRIRMPSKLDPHVATIEGWLATEPQITALAIVRRLDRDRSRASSAISSTRSCSGCSRRSGGRPQRSGRRDGGRRHGLYPIARIGPDPSHSPSRRARRETRHDRSVRRRQIGALG